MNGIELVHARVNEADDSQIAQVKKSLYDALLTHILTGESLDCLLKLKAAGDGTRTPRVQVVLQLRGEALVSAWEWIRNHYQHSDRQSAFLLFAMLHDKEHIPAEIEDTIATINLYSSILNQQPSKPEALYQAIINLLAAL